jgi:tetratricopeptide (TPR) repeat protein
MKQDRRGLEVTTDSEEVIGAIDRFSDEIISLRPGFDRIGAAAKAHPECAMLQACTAMLGVFSQLPGEAAAARRLLDGPKARLSGITERERLFIAAVDAGCAGDLDGALEISEQIVRRWPRDRLAAKLSEFYCFETGNARGQLRVMSAMEESNRDEPHMLSMYAFALELCERRGESEVVARKALELDPLTTWAQHCLAHVWAGDGRVGEGIATLEQFAPDWPAFVHYIDSHNWFHLATLYLADLRYEAALKAYREHIWGFTPSLVVEHTDAILLLWYLELAGRDVGEAWKEIAPHAAKYAGEHLFPFLNAIYLYALERAGESERVNLELESTQRFADQLGGGNRALVWGKIGLPLIQASVRYARGDYDRCAELLEAVLPEVWRAGGSDEQRRVFFESHLMSLIKSRNRARASRALEDLIAGRRATRLENLWRDKIGATPRRSNRS